jgi:hypothetical protein
MAGLSPASHLLRWIRKVHAWIGLSGAAFGLLFGVTGILLNHRAVMKVEAGRSEETRVQIELPEPAQNPEALAQTLRQQFGWETDRVRVRQQPGRPARIQGREVKAAETWLVTYGGHAHWARAAYQPGNRTVEVEQRKGDLLEALKRLHKAEAGQVGWILLADAFAGAMILLTLTGLLLWTRMAGPRVLALALGLGGGLALLLTAARAW